MTHALSRRVALLLAAAVATFCIALALSSSPASASGYCGGSRVNYVNPCFGAARSLAGVTGHGQSTSICVGANEISGPCSSGPGAIATLNLGSYANRVPWLTGNAMSWTIAWGETF